MASHTFHKLIILLPKKCCSILVVAAAFVLITAFPSQSQSPADAASPEPLATNYSQDDLALLSSRRNDLVRLETFNGLEANQVILQGKLLQICPAFKKHLFVKYEGGTTGDVEFIAVYPRTVGVVHLITWEGGFSHKLEPASLRKSTIAAFNEIWLEERGGTAQTSPVSGLNWGSLAACYAEFAGEQLFLPPNVQRSEIVAPKTTLDFEHEKASKVVFKVSTEPQSASLSLDFDRFGFVKSVARTPNLPSRPIP